MIKLYVCFDKNDVVVLFVDHQVGLFFFVWDIEFDKFKNNVLVLGDLVKYFNLLIIFIISFEIGFNGLLVLELKV